MILKQNADGKIELTPDEFEAVLGDVATKTVDAYDKAHPPKTTLPGGGPSPDDPQRFYEPANETAAHKSRRLKEATIAVRGGKLRIEDAPKEIRTIRFFKALGERQTDPDAPAIIKALSEGSATDGGNLVPVEFGTDLLVAIEEYGTVRRDSTQYTMNTNELDLRTVTTKPTVSRKGELVASDESATKFGKPLLKCDMYTGKQVMSRELFEDNNVGLYQRLIDLFAEQFAKAEDYEGLVSTYYPGVLASVTPKTTPMTGTSFANILYKELVTVKNSLSRGQLARGGKWYMHREIMGVIESIEDNQGRPIVQNPFGPTMPSLLGYPVELNEIMPSLADDGADKPFIVFGNLMWVAFGSRTGFTAETLREATLTVSGGGSVNLADQRAYGLVIDARWGLNVTIPSNIAVLRTHA